MKLSNKELREAIDKTASQLTPRPLSVAMDKVTRRLMQRHLMRLQAEEQRRATEEGSKN